MLNIYVSHAAMQQVVLSMTSIFHGMHMFYQTVVFCMCFHPWFCWTQLHGLGMCMQLYRHPFMGSHLLTCHTCGSRHGTRRVCAVLLVCLFQTCVVTSSGCSGAAAVHLLI